MMRGAGTARGGRGAPGRLAAAAAACALALGALAPAAALADGGMDPMDGRSTEVTVMAGKLVKDGETGRVIGNLAVTVPTQVPLAVGGHDDVHHDEVRGADNMAIRNTGSLDLVLSRIRADGLDGAFELAGSEEAVEAATTQENLLYVGLTLTSETLRDGEGGARATTFSLAQAASAETDGHDPQWVIPAGGASGDALTVAEGSRVGHLTRDLTVARPLASVEWTFDYHAGA